MSENLNVVPDEYRRAAIEHRETAERLGALPDRHDELLASLESLGPIFNDFKEAGRDLLEKRRICYEQQAAAHQELANKLEYAAAMWESQDADGARAFGAVLSENEGAS